MAKRNNKTGEITFKEEENPILVKEVEEKPAKSNIDDLLAAIKLMNSNLNDNFKDLTNNVSTLSKNITEVNKKPSEKTKKASTKADTKLLDAVTSTNENIGKLVKALSEQNKPKRNRRTQEQLSIDRIKANREKALNDHNAKLYALKEKEIQQRMDLTKKSHESYMKKHYAEDSLTYKAITSPYRAYNNIQSQGSNSLSALGISLLSGGIINPVIAKEFGLDKILTGTTKFAGRTFAKAGATAWNMTGGLALKNLTQPFVDKDSRLRQGMTSGANKVSNALRNPLSLFKKDETTESDGKQVGAVAKDKDKMNKLQKTVEDIKNYITKPKDETQPKEKEKKKSLLDKIFEAIGGMGLILKGAAVAAIPYVVKEFLPKATEWLDEKFKGFLTGTIGLSEGGAAVVDQLVKDALPGALFGLTVDGLKGAIVGGLLSIAAKNLYRLGEKLGEWAADAVNWISENPISSLFIGALGIGSFKKIKNAIGKLVPSIKGIGTKLKDITKTIGSKATSWLSDIGKAVKGALSKIPEVANKAVDSLKNIGKNLKEGTKNLGKKAVDVTKKAAKETKELAKKAGNGVKNTAKNAVKNGKNIVKKAALPVAAALEVGSDIYDIANSDKPSEVAAKELLEKRKKNGFESGWDYINPYKYGQQFALATGLDSFVEGVVDSIYKTKSPAEAMKEAEEKAREKFGTTGPSLKSDNQGGGYGTLGPSSYGNIIHGTKATGLKDMGLKGTVVSSNSIPFIASQNEQSLKALDETLNGWGYDVIYTSAMGGHRPGTGHWKGNKVDLQLKKNGRPTHLSGQQLNILGQAGYWGRGTGALGWEPVSGQVGGGHYDLYIAGGNSGTALASAANIKLETKDMPTAQEAQTFAMNEMNETTQAAAENTANSNDSILGMLDSMNSNIASNATSPTGGYSGGSSFNTASADMPSISLSMPGQGGGNDKRDNTIYAFGDVAKTPILYTM